MEIVAHQGDAIDSWTSQNMDWSDPDPCNPSYWYALWLAIRERCLFCGVYLKEVTETGLKGLGRTTDATGLRLWCPCGFAEGASQAVEKLRSALALIAPQYVDPDKIKTGLNLKVENEQPTDGSASLPAWSIAQGKSIDEIFYSYALLSKRFPGITEHGRTDVWTRDEGGENHKKFKAFLRDFKQCIDLLYMIGVHNVANGGFWRATVSGASESSEDFNKFNNGIILMESSLAVSGVVGNSGLPDGREYWYSTSNDSLEDAQKSIAGYLKRYPADVTTAVSNALDMASGSFPDILEATLDDGSAVWDGMSHYVYPRTDLSVLYYKTYKYVKEVNKKGDTETLYTNKTYLRYSLEASEFNSSDAGVYLQGTTLVSYIGKAKFYYSDPDDPAAPQTEIEVGPTYSAQVVLPYRKIRVLPPVSFAKNQGVKLEVYSFAWFRNDSDVKTGTFSVPPGSHICNKEMVVGDPEVISLNEDSGGFEVVLGTVDAAPSAQTPSKEAPEALSGYKARVWAFFNGKEAFKFSPSA